MKKRLFITLGLVLGLSCGISASASKTAYKRVTVRVIATNDFHGRVHRLPWFAGHLNNLRKQARQAGEGVLLLDAGDMFQGTLESNLNEGAVVIDAYNALGYTAVTIGNHEYDFGPVGPAVTAKSPGDDPRGALKARAMQAKFPFLAANTVETSTGKPPAWENVHPSTLVQVSGVKVGLIGVTTTETASSTVAANVVGLRFPPLVKSIEREATAMRAAGAAAVIVLAHEGGECRSVSDSKDVSSCDLNEPIAKVARALHPGLVDLIVAGHTHQQMAHVINGIPVIESKANGQAFGRVDLHIDERHKRVTAAKVFQPRNICKEARGEACTTEPYAGGDVKADPRILAIIQPAITRASKVKNRSLGVVVEQALRRDYKQESSLGNFFADQMLRARPKADVAIINAGALRVNLTKGLLTYGQLYEVHPFDNNFARITLSGAQLRAILLRNLKSPAGILSIAGITVNANCSQGMLELAMLRPNGQRIRDEDVITVTTSDFLATGGDDLFRRKHLARDAVAIEDTNIRDTLAKQLLKQGGTVRGDDFLRTRRWNHPGRRPMRCSP